MTSRGFKELEQKIRASKKQFKERLQVMNLLGHDFDAVLGLVPESECCLVALGCGCPAAPGEADFWFEDCCC